MHLKQLKIAGFKSFVEPTHLQFSSQLVAVVGPNGCGKSNLIDAVRWVMGESSAKNLRGESMADVIFNGSSQRKGLGQASVELIFDNSLGRLVGPYGSYAEISVKRIVTRVGESSYYLNGTRCRRRDITDIFLGTGAGKRGYSIIGQGTITQLIEGTPEELRGFLEEAAGVSKYKERRRETLQRIELTRDNLTRLADIREELDKQLNRLGRQAKSAARYYELKTQEKLCKAEILALKHQDLMKQQILKQQELVKLQVQLEEQQSFITRAQLEGAVLSETIQTTNEHWQQSQNAFYKMGTDIVRLEEAIQQQDREKKRLEEDNLQLQQEWDRVQGQFQEDQTDLEARLLKVQTCEERVQNLTFELEQKQLHWQHAENSHKEWERLWQEFQNKAHAIQREFQVTQVNWQHMETKRKDCMSRMQRLTMAQTSIFLADLQTKHQDLEKKQQQCLADQEMDEKQTNQQIDCINQLRTTLQGVNQGLHQLQDDFHSINSEYLALIATQRAASLRTKKSGIEAWADKPRLVDVFQIEPQWQKACELVLHDALGAYVLDDLDSLWSMWDACQNQAESIVTLRPVSQAAQTYPRLVDKMDQFIPAAMPFLESIYIAKDEAEALLWRPTLLDHESIVTPQGLWLGKGWVKFPDHREQKELGLLGRQQKIEELSKRVQEFQKKIELSRTERDQLQNQLQTQEKELERSQLNLKNSTKALNTNKLAVHEAQQALNQAKKEIENYATDLAFLQNELEETLIQLQSLEMKQDQFEHQCQEIEKQQERHSNEKKTREAAFACERSQMEECRNAKHQAEMEYDREMHAIEKLKDNILKGSDRLQGLEGKLEQNASSRLQSTQPTLELKEQLAVLFEKHQHLELSLRELQDNLSQLKIRMSALEKDNLNHAEEIKRIQELIAEIKMQEQALLVRAHSIEELLTELELKAEALLRTIPAEVTQSMREEELLRISDKIRNLGAINLAAIDEYAMENQRKQYLDAQSEDLSQALSTLQIAIEKMDKETRFRLENTFDAVNTAFKALFPRLFGGGKAQLELTCDNLLEAGIVVMAQPPGKRNSTIHLLSGGEKAMTAVALVFAIFQLNPSPFCMLDEVDAPLDDVNIGRFCDLVKEMSQFVQFLFITHNKVTMELADDLIGVTMREPGVSRLVTVDVKQAVTMR